MILHRVLKSQLLRAGLGDETRPPEVATWRALLDLLNAHFELADADRHRLSRAAQEIKGLYADLAHERYKLHAVVGSLELGVGALDAQGRVLFLNPAAESWLGYPEGELPEGFLSLIEPDMDATLAELLASGRNWSSREHGLRCQDGSYLPVSLKLNPMLREGRLLGAVVVIDPNVDSSSLGGASPEQLQYALSGLSEALTELVRSPLPPAARGLLENACGYADMLAAGLQGASLGLDLEAGVELSGLRVLLVGPRTPGMLSLRRRLTDLGVCLAEAVESTRGLALAKEAGRRERGFDAAVVDLSQAELEQFRQAEVPIIELADLPRPLHPADLLVALRTPSTARTDAYDAISETPLRVCVVERDERDTTLLEECVTDLNQEFILAGDGAEAWDLYNEEPVDLILGSFAMKGLNGEELCRRLRDEAADRATAVVLIVGNDKEARKARRLGADATINEPLERDNLKRLLRRLARDKARRQVAVGG